MPTAARRRCRRELWQRWNFDPLLLGGLVVLAVWIGRGRSADARAGWAAIALMVLVFVSPLCALSSALFSARVLHHVLLIAAVAPLLARAFPLARLPSPPLALLVALNAIVLWLWHAPGPYAWGLASVPAYWLMQATLLGAAWLLWRAVLAPTRADRRSAVRAGGDGRTDGAAGCVAGVRAAAAVLAALRVHRRLGLDARWPTSNWPGC